MLYNSMGFQKIIFFIRLKFKIGTLKNNIYCDSMAHGVSFQKDQWRSVAQVSDTTMMP